MVSVLSTGGSVITWNFGGSLRFSTGIPSGFQVSPDGISWYDASQSRGTQTGTAISIGYAVTPSSGWYWQLLAGYNTNFANTVPINAPEYGLVL